MAPHERRKPQRYSQCNMMNENGFECNNRLTNKIISISDSSSSSDTKTSGEANFLATSTRQNIISSSSQRTNQKQHMRSSIHNHGAKHGSSSSRSAKRPQHKLIRSQDELNQDHTMSALRCIECPNEPVVQRRQATSPARSSDISQQQQQLRHQQQQLHSISLSAMVCTSFALMLIAMTLSGASMIQTAEARITFEKMTNRDFSGIAYYTIQNVSLFECLGWCKEEQSCTSAVFSFVVNPFAALQETTCVLQNETQARQGAYLRTSTGVNGGQLSLGGDGGSGNGALSLAQPQKATNLYFFNKIELPTESVCSRLWAFERFPNRRLRQRDRQSFHAGSKEACQAACMNDSRFVCRSLEYNYITQQCTLSQHDRRSPLVQHLSQQVAAMSSNSMSNHNNNDLIETPATDYFENACLLGEDICNESRIYDYPKVGLPLQRVAHFVELNYYPDKEMLVKSQAGCVRACTIEHEFICRSILYRSSFKQGQPNCALYHLDQRTFPEGADAFMSHTMQPLLDSGETSAVYLEAICNDSLPASVLQPTQSSMMSITTTSSGLLGQQSQRESTMTMPPTSITIMPSSTTPGGVHVMHQHHQQQLHQSHQSHHQQQQQQQQVTTLASTSVSGGSGGLSGHYNSSASSIDPHERFQVQMSGPSTSAQGLSAVASTLSPLLGGPPTTIRLPAPFLPGGGNSLPPSTIHIGSDSSPSASTIQQRPYTARPPQNILISPAPPPGSQSRDPMSGGNGLIDPNSNHMQITTSNGPASHDQNCDAHGFCYDVALKCTDTKMVVNVKTQRPFFGRIYALGRSETCNANIKNQNQFQLDMYLTGQECNTQSVVSIIPAAVAVQVLYIILHSLHGLDNDLAGQRHRADKADNRCQLSPVQELRLDSSKSVIVSCSSSFLLPFPIQSARCRRLSFEIVVVVWIIRTIVATVDVCVLTETLERADNSHLFVVRYLANSSTETFVVAI